MSRTKKNKPGANTRAARRQTSPTPGGSAKPTGADSTDQPWLYHAQNAGISKKRKNKQQTRQQKVRQQRSLENAERNTAKLEHKVADSKRRAKKIQARRAEWEDTNDQAVVEQDRPPLSAALGERKETWADKMVEVELKEAMRDIEGFELPNLGTEDRKVLPSNAFDVEAINRPAAEAKTTDDFDEIT